MKIINVIRNVKTLKTIVDSVIRIKLVLNAKMGTPQDSKMEPDSAFLIKKKLQKLNKKRERNKIRIRIRMNSNPTITKTQKIMKKINNNQEKELRKEFKKDNKNPQILVNKILVYFINNHVYIIL